MYRYMYGTLNDQTNGVGLDTITEEDKPNGDSCVVSERELCSALSDLTVSERVKENGGVYRTRKTGDHVKE